MQRRTFFVLGTLAVLALAVIVPVAASGGDDDATGSQQQDLVALGNSFTFQGRLTDAGSPANGTYDFVFYLYDALSGGNQVGPTNTVGDVAVSSGLFNVDLNFGDVFHGAKYFLEVQVRPGSSAGAYTVLSPREPLGAVPNARYAVEAQSISLPYSASDSWAGALYEVSNSNAGSNSITMLAEANAGKALVATSASGAAALLSSGTGPSAVLDGPLSVAGANHPTAFVHVATGGSYVSVIDNPLLNGDPNAIVIATHVYNPPGPGGSIYQTAPYSVYYNGSKWAIYNDNISEIVANTAFFVLVIKQ
jgi:hypothetical protein